MTCFFCKGNMADTTNTYMEDLGGCIMIVKNVPCRKCTQCGEVVYGGDVIRRLEKLAESLKDSLTEVAIVNYQIKAA